MKIRLLATSAISIVMLPSTASAQDAATLPPTGPTATPSADKPADTDGDIVVTAQRRSENLQNVPLAITAYTGDQLTRSGVRSTKDLTLVTPGLNFSQSTQVPQPTIRGIGLRSSAAGDESVVPIYVDGIYQPFLYSAISDLVGLERVEVLRGPQSALYGRNATGGAINFVTKDPLGSPQSDLSFRYGRFNETDATAYLATGGETIGATIAGRWRRDDGYSYDSLRNERGAEVDNTTVRGRVAWAPSATLRFDVVGFYQNQNGDVAQVVKALDGNTVARRLNPAVRIENRPYFFANTFDTNTKVITHNVALTSSLDVGAAKLTLINSYYYGRHHSNNDNDATPDNVVNTFIDVTGRSLYNEFYASSQWAGPVSMIVGAVYYHDVSRAAPIASQSPTTGGLQTFYTTSRVETDSLAFYGQGDVEFTSALKLTVGARYTTEKKHYEVTQTRTLPSGVNSVTAAPASNAARFDKLTPSATLSFAANDGLNLYARYAKAFKSGVFNTFSTNITPVRPENVTQYEIGLKSQLARGLRFNLSGYRTDETDLQVTARDPVTNTVFLQNAASARIWGLEGELFWQSGAGLNVRANGSWTNGKYRSFPNASVTIPLTAVNPTPATACVLGTGPLLGGNRAVICDVSGNRLIRVPRFTANLSSDYGFDLAGGKASLSGNLAYIDRVYYDALNRLTAPGYVVVNAMATWTEPKGHLELGVGVDNLFDKYRILSEITSSNNDTYTDDRPRSWYVQARYRF